MSQKLLVKTIDEDRFARATEVILGEKTFLTPNFCTLIKRADEFDSLIRLSLLNTPKYLGSYAIRIFDTINTILPKLESQNQRRLEDNESVEELFLKFNQNNITFIDPSLEYLLYEFHAGKFLRTLKRVKKSKQLNILIKYLEEREAKKQMLNTDSYERWKKAFHRKLWYDLDRNHIERNKFVGDFLDLEDFCGTDILIPPVPIVDSEGMLDIAMRINNLARAIAPRTKPCATYFLLQKGVLRNESLIKKIVQILKADPSQITIFKIKNLDLWNSGRIVQRENYKKLMDAMYDSRKTNPDKLYVLFESWYQSFPSACYGFNIVSTSMHGYDKDSEFGKNSRGSWFDPDLMWYIPYDELKKSIRNTENRLPCYCTVCKSISNLDSIEIDNWNILRREHYVLVMNEYMRMISQAIEDRNIELAREKLANSELSRLQNLIPRG